MKQFVRYACFALALTALTPLAQAQTNPIPYVPSTDEQVKRAVDEALRQHYTAGDADGAIVSSDGKVTPLSGALGGEQQPPKKYQYQKPKGAFREHELPPRTFNNIPYPY